MFKSVWLRRFWPWPLGAGLLLAVVWLQGQRLQVIQSTEAQPLAQLQLQDQRDLAQLLLLRQLPTFGYDNMVANWTFLNFLQYFGNMEVRSQLGYRLSPEFFEVIVGNDPYFVTPYLYLSTSTSLFAGDPDRAVDLMTQGVSTMTPNTPEGGYFVWRYMGIDKLLFLGDGEGARESFETAADWAEQSTLPDAESVAQASRQTAQFLAENPTSKAAQISAWAQIASHAVDDETRRLAIERIESLGGEILADEQGRITVRYRTDE
ncbi:MAG: hypothetical protein EA367_08390 [Leptolyngbya sp. DLM2.Bin15]|nr:MAG: hypothetical protein EA367_08390 [Leptolyngbya sp. DLM2.Bin15]